MFPAHGQLGRTFPSSEAALAPLRAALSAAPAPPSIWNPFGSSDPRLAGVVGMPESRLTYSAGCGRSRITYHISLCIQNSPEGWRVSYRYDRVPTVQFIALLGVLTFISIAVWSGPNFAILLCLGGFATAALLIKGSSLQHYGHELEQTLKLMYDDDFTERERLAPHPVAKTSHTSPPH